MNRDAATHMMTTVIRRGLTVGMATAIVVAILVAGGYILSGEEARLPIMALYAVISFVAVQLIGILFAGLAGLTAGVWFEQRETPFEFAIQPHRLKAAVWGLFCLVLPLLVLIGSWILGNEMSLAVRHAQYMFVLAVVASFVVNNVINSMATDIRDDPRSKQKRLTKADASTE